jgi:hypothetical protein
MRRPKDHTIRKSYNPKTTIQRYRKPTSRNAQPKQPAPRNQTINHSPIPQKPNHPNQTNIPPCPSHKTQPSPGQTPRNKTQPTRRRQRIPSITIFMMRMNTGPKPRTKPAPTHSQRPTPNQQTPEQTTHPQIQRAAIAPLSQPRSSTREKEPTPTHYLQSTRKTAPVNRELSGDERYVKRGRTNITLPLRPTRHPHSPTTIFDARKTPE